MNVKELMIGNYLKVPHDGPISRIVEICKDRENFFGYFVKLENGYRCTLVGEMNGVKIVGCEPIPLTEEWDGKFKFKKTGYRLVCYENNKYIFEMTVEETGGFLGRRKYFVPITIVEYVHQVQNLYFALTGKELEIK